MSTAACTEPSLAACLPPRLARWAAHFNGAATVYGVDPFTLAAICDRESLGGDALQPPGPAGTGDTGHGRGLMQVDDRAHPDFCRQLMGDGSPAWADPESNILEGARVLKSALDALGEDYQAAIAAYNAGVGAARKALESLQLSASPADKVAALDEVTTGHNYLSDVLRRRDAFLHSQTGA